MYDNEIVAKILNFVRENGGVHSDFKLGITNNVDERLVQHGAGNNPRIFYDLASREIAKDTENYLLSCYMFKGDTGGGESNTTWIYCFKV